MHPSFRLFPVLLAKTSGHETRPGSSQDTWAAAGLEQSLPSSLFWLRYSARQIGAHKTTRFQYGEILCIASRVITEKKPMIGSLGFEEQGYLAPW